MKVMLEDQNHNKLQFDEERKMKKFKSFFAVGKDFKFLITFKIKSLKWTNENVLIKSFLSLDFSKSFYELFIFPLSLFSRIFAENSTANLS